MSHLPSRSRIFLKIVLMVPFLLGNGVTYLHAQGVMQGFEDEIQAIFTHTQDSVVRIKAIAPVVDSHTDKVIGEGLSVGTGFFVDSQGHILTTASVLCGSKEALVYWRGKTYEAQSLGQDVRTNLALLEIKATTPYLPIGDPETLKTGSMTLAVGYPLEGPISAEYGFVSDPSATPLATRMPQFFATTLIRSSVRAQPGQSGSPFLNRKGEVVGMVVAAMEDGNSMFAIPITAAQKIQHDLLKFHAPRHGWTGLTIEVQNHVPFSKNGITIRDVYESYPAHIAGIRTGDVLLKIGDKYIHTLADVINATFYLSIGETVNFTIDRLGENKVIPVKVVPRPSDKELLALKLVPTSAALR